MESSNVKGIALHSMSRSQCTLGMAHNWLPCSCLAKCSNVLPLVMQKQQAQDQQEGATLLGRGMVCLSSEPSDKRDISRPAAALGPLGPRNLNRVCSWPVYSMSVWMFCRFKPAELTQLDLQGTTHIG